MPPEISLREGFLRDIRKIPDAQAITPAAALRRLALETPPRRIESARGRHAKGDRQHPCQVADRNDCVRDLRRKRRAAGRDHITAHRNPQISEKTFDGPDVRLVLQPRIGKAANLDAPCSASAPDRRRELAGDRSGEGLGFEDNDPRGDTNEVVELD
jgi:hypothetical protein